MKITRRILPVLLIIFTLVIHCRYVAASDIGSDLKISASFNQKSITVHKNTTFEFNILLDADKTAKVSAAKLLIKYSSSIVEYVGSSKPNKECQKNNYKLNQTLAAKDEKKQGILEITKVLIATDDKLPSGHFCFDTLIFKAKPSLWFIIPWYKRSGSIGFTDLKNWQIVGPNGELAVSQPNSPELSVNVIN